MKNYINLYLKIIIISLICFLLLIVSVIGIISVISTQISWNNFKTNYSEELILNNNNVLSYTKNNKKFIIDTIYNTNGAEIFLNTPFYMAGVKNIFNPPNNYYMSLYLNKDNPNTGIFITPSEESTMKNPIFLLFAYVFLGIASVNYYIVHRKYFNFFRINSEKTNNKDNTFSKKIIFYLGLVLFLIGFSTIISISKDLYTYFELRTQNNLVTSTNYSKLYFNYDLKNFTIITKYNINDKDYLYSNTKSSLIYSNSINTNPDTVDLFYDKSNPSKVVEKNLKPEFFSITFLLFLGFFGYKISIEPFILNYKKNKNKDKTKIEANKDENNNDNNNEDIIK